MKKLYVGNLPYSATTEQIGDFLKNLFPEIEEMQLGEISIITDRETGRSKGFGFVEVNDDAQADIIIAKFADASFMNSSEAQLEGRALRINEARPKEERTTRRDSNGGGRYSNNRGGYGNRSYNSGYGDDMQHAA